MQLAADQLVRLGNGHDLLDTGQRFKIAQVLLDCPDDAEDGLLHTFDFPDQIVFRDQNFLQLLDLFLCNSFPQNQDHDVLLVFSLILAHIVKKKPQGVILGVPNKKPREDLRSTRGFATRSFYPGGSRLKKLKKPKKSRLGILSRLLF